MYPCESQTAVFSTFLETDILRDWPRKREGYWIFSTVFVKTIESLGQKLKVHQAPAQNQDQIDRERLFVEIAKGA